MSWCPKATTWISEGKEGKKIDSLAKKKKKSFD